MIFQKSIVEEDTLCKMMLIWYHFGPATDYYIFAIDS